MTRRAERDVERFEGDALFPYKASDRWTGRYR